VRPRRPRAQRIERAATGERDLVARLQRRVLGGGDRGAQARLGVGAASQPPQRLGARDVDIGGGVVGRAEVGGRGERLVEGRKRALVGALV